jgi:methylenetetrahydrofolate reductase (NADPH)
MGQYRKLRLKCQNGAAFVITQLGYDMRKSHELLLYMAEMGLTQPMFGNIYLLKKAVANIFHQGLVPGCLVSERLKNAVAEAYDRKAGKPFCQDLAAKQYALFKGLGYRGVYFGGVEKVDEILAIIDKGEEYARGDWKALAGDVIWPQPKDYYMYAPDPQTGLATAARAPGGAADGHNTVDRRQITLSYRFNRLFHNMVFDPKAPLFKPARWMYSKLIHHPRLYKFVFFWEKMSKTALFDCRSCGDCSLADVQYLCPKSQCAKNQRNGPCGGSREGRCEILQQPCIWYRAYERAKHYGELDEFLNRASILTDSQLLGTSSWANAFLGRDHSHLGVSAKGNGNGDGKAAQPAPAKVATPADKPAEKPVEKTPAGV